MDALRKLPDNSIHSVVTDPPYGLSNVSMRHVRETLEKWVTTDREYTPTVGGGFMGNDWDSFVPPPAVWDEVLRVLKPGGHLLCFAGTRTLGLMEMSIVLAGFDIRDSIAWMYGTGFPKGQDMGKLISKATPDNTDDIKKWIGWNSVLKPAFEPIIMAQKPFKGSVSANVVSHSTGGINIDATRVGGRYPANVILDEDQAEVLDEQSGITRSTGGSGDKSRGALGKTIYGKYEDKGQALANAGGLGDVGGASRFFYVAKASKSERVVVNGVTHPTVKPLTLMRHLVKLVTPPGGVVLDPFAGSGTSVEAALLEGFKSIGIELESSYLPLILARIERI